MNVVFPLGNICCGHKMFLNKIWNIFCVPDTKFVSATNVARGQTWKHLCRQQCVRNNVSSFARALIAVARATRHKNIVTHKSGFQFPDNLSKHWDNKLTRILTAAIWGHFVGAFHDARRIYVPTGVSGFHMRSSLCKHVLVGRKREWYSHRGNCCITGVSVWLSQRASLFAFPLKFNVS